VLLLLHSLGTNHNVWDDQTAKGLPLRKSAEKQRGTDSKGRDSCLSAWTEAQRHSGMFLLPDPPARPKA
jgi:hypothetical protein